MTSYATLFLAAYRLNGMGGFQAQKNPRGAGYGKGLLLMEYFINAGDSYHGSNESQESQHRADHPLHCRN